VGLLFDEREYRLAQNESCSTLLALFAKPDERESPVSFGRVIPRPAQVKIWVALTDLREPEGNWEI
jgi:hypothetical protein